MRSVKKATSGSRGFREDHPLQRNLRHNRHSIVSANTRPVGDGGGGGGVQPDCPDEQPSILFNDKDLRDKERLKRDPARAD